MKLKQQQLPISRHFRFNWIIKARVTCLPTFLPSDVKKSTASRQRQNTSEAIFSRSIFGFGAKALRWSNSVEKQLLLFSPTSSSTAFLILGLTSGFKFAVFGLFVEIKDQMSYQLRILVSGYWFCDHVTPGRVRAWIVEFNLHQFSPIFIWKANKHYSNLSTAQQTFFSPHHCSVHPLKQGNNISLPSILDRYQEWLPFPGWVLLLLRP